MKWIDHTNLFIVVYKRRALSQSNDEEDFVTRYERLTGAQQDFSVFSSNLPGTKCRHYYLFDLTKHVGIQFHKTQNYIIKLN